MFSTLRSRFSVMFALLIAIVLCMAAAMMLLLARSIPIRTTNIRLQELSRIIYAREDIAGLEPARQAAVLQRLADLNNIRILIAGPEGEILYDSGAGVLPKINRIPPPSLPDRNNNSFPGGTFRDANRRPWQYILRPIDDRMTLVLAAPQPRIQSLTILTDDLLPPLLWVAGFTLLLAILLAGLTARWVSRPLDQIVSATRQVPDGRFTPIEETGPLEVRQLARAFNEMNAQVAAGKRSQQDFVANVSHELKTPLTAIQGFAQAIVDGTAATGAEIRQAAAVIHGESGRMHRLVLDLLDLARIEGGTLTFDREPVELSALLENLVAKFTPIAQEARIELIHTQTALPILYGDGDRLMQVFTNLLDNAIKHSPESSRVEVRAEQHGSDILVHFIDSGRGIPAAEQERIFERFYQLDKARARSKYPGFGLGLAIAQEIAHAHGGEILLESGSGRGSDFVVKLPFT